MSANWAKERLHKWWWSKQILRLVSFDALLRKLRFDFSDTFSDDFDFDSLKVMRPLNVLVSKNTYVDGLVADIAFNGQIDLVKRQINVEAVITPEISATVGVATAFVVNPFAGVLRQRKCSVHYGVKFPLFVTE